MQVPRGKTKGRQFGNNCDSSVITGPITLNLPKNVDTHLVVYLHVSQLVCYCTCARARQRSFQISRTAEPIAQAAPLLPVFDLGPCWITWPANKDVTLPRGVWRRTKISLPSWSWEAEKTLPVGDEWGTQLCIGQFDFNLKRMVLSNIIDAVHQPCRSRDLSLSWPVSYRGCGPNSVAPLTGLSGQHPHVGRRVWWARENGTHQPFGLLLAVLAGLNWQHVSLHISISLCSCRMLVSADRYRLNMAENKSIANDSEFPNAATCLSFDSLFLFTHLAFPYVINTFSSAQMSLCPSCTREPTFLFLVIANPNAHCTAARTTVPARLSYRRRHQNILTWRHTRKRSSKLIQGQWLHMT